MTYSTENNIRFANITEEQMNTLISILPKNLTLIIPNESVDKIKDFLKLEELSDEDLQATRNGIVKAFGEKIQKERENLDENIWSYQNVMSSVVTVIDSVKWNRGLEI